MAEWFQEKKSTINGWRELTFNRKFRNETAWDLDHFFSYYFKDRKNFLERKNLKSKNGNSMQTMIYSGHQGSLTFFFDFQKLQHFETWYLH